MELTVWGGKWGLASVSAECLEALAYCKFAAAIHRVHLRKYIFSSDMAPLLWNRADGKSVRGAKDVIAYLKEERHNMDAQLTSSEKADILAYKTMVQHKLIPALNFAMWCDERNYVEVLRPTMARLVTFPCNYTLPGRMQRRRLREMWARFGETAEPQDVETRLNRDARECLMALAERLGPGPYFFGSRATSFDAYVFSQLCLVLKVPLPNSNLCAHLKTFPNLVDYVNRIHNKYLASEVRKHSSPAKSRPEWVGLALSISFAATVMISYAVVKGILQIDIVDE